MKNKFDVRVFRRELNLLVLQRFRQTPQEADIVNVSRCFFILINYKH